MGGRKGRESLNSLIYLSVFGGRESERHLATHPQQPLPRWAPWRGLSHVIRGIGALFWSFPQKTLRGVPRCTDVETWEWIWPHVFGQHHSISVFLDKRPTPGWFLGKGKDKFVRNATNQPLFCMVVPNSHSLPLRQVAQVVLWFAVLVRCAIPRFAPMLGKTPRAP